MKERIGERRDEMKWFACGLQIRKSALQRRKGDGRRRHCGMVDSTEVQCNIVLIFMTVDDKMINEKRIEE